MKAAAMTRESRRLVKSMAVAVAHKGQDVILLESGLSP